MQTAEERKASYAAYHTTHREERLAWQKAYYALHREECRAYGRAYGRAYSVTHREERRTLAAAYTASHREERKAYSKAYRASHPEEGRLQTARRNARKCGLPDTLTLPQWEAIKVAYSHRCAYCGVKPRTLTKDHVLPLMRGGGTTADNIVPACYSCNSRKQDRPPPLIPALRLLL